MACLLLDNLTPICANTAPFPNHPGNHHFIGRDRARLFCPAGDPALGGGLDRGDGVETARELVARAPLSRTPGRGGGRRRAGVRPGVRGLLFEPPGE